MPLETKLDIDQIAPVEYPEGLYDFAATVTPLTGLPVNPCDICDQYCQAGFVSFNDAFSED